MPETPVEILTGETPTEESNNVTDENGKGSKTQVLADLAKERDARQALEAQLARLQPLQAIADALGGSSTGDESTDLQVLTERLTRHETELATERAARWRAEVAHEKGLTAVQAKRLQGSTREELLADADDLLASFPVAPPVPRLDPSQGARPELDSGGLAAGAAKYEAQKQNKGPTYQ